MRLVIRPPSLRRAFMLATSATLLACAFDPTAGTKPMASPAKMDDAEQAHDDRESLRNPVPPAPTVGVSLVAGGQKMDSGALPPSPVPIAAPK